jgi:hypothetical protein
MAQQPEENLPVAHEAEAAHGGKVALQPVVREGFCQERGLHRRRAAVFY